MFTFLAPAALLGLSLLAIPIIVHLLKPRKVRRTPFSSLRWLHLTQQRLSRRLRWHQLLLFLLRAGFITALVIALARPLWHSPSSTASGALATDRVLVVDVSRSMGYRAGDEPSSLEQAQFAAQRVLEAEQPHDRTAILVTGNSTRILSPFTAEAKRFAPAIAELKATNTDTDLSSALQVTRSLLTQRRPEARCELLVFTDNHQGAWRASGIDELRDTLSEQSQVTVIDVSARSPQNGYIAAARYTPAETNSPGRIDVQLRGVGPTQERSVRLTGVTGGAREQSVTLRPGEAREVTFELPANLPPGATAEIVLEPFDALPGDDHWYLTLDEHAALTALVIEGRGASHVTSGFALQTALRALSTPAARLKVVAKSSTEVTSDDVSAADVILWADVPELADGIVKEIEQRVRAGLGLAVFMGPHVSTDLYNAQLFRPLQPAQGLLPQRLDRVANVPASQGGLQAWQITAWQHPLFAGLFDPLVGDLGDVQVQSYYRFAGALPATATTLVTVGEAPVWIEQPVGSGVVAWCALSADDTWSDLPRRKSFVPLVDRLVGQLSQGATRRSFTIGEAIQLAVSTPETGQASFQVRTPSGSTLTPSVSTLGSRTVLRLPAVDEPGVYHIEHGGKSLADANFIVQLGRGDSRLTPTDSAQLREWWQPVAFTQARPAEALSELARQAPATSLTTLLLLLAAGLFIAEMLFVHWLCPRMNPALAGSLIQGRRLVVASSAAGQSASPPASAPAPNLT